MAPVRYYSNWNKRTVDETQNETNRKYYILYEGINTEKWYFEELINLRKELKIKSTIDLIPLEKYDNDTGSSNPIKLIELANKTKNDYIESFDKERDKIIIVFDVDIYKNKNETLNKILSKGFANKNNIMAISNPSFELFLLLHKENSYKEIIEPNKNKILENKKVGNNRYVQTLLTRHTQMNPKKNEKIGELAKFVKTAIEEEKNINEDITDAEKCLSNLTCNLGKIISSILDE